MDRSVRHALAVLMCAALVAMVAAPVAGYAVAPAGGTVTPQALFAPDSYEPDDTTETATVYNPATMGNTFASMHTFDGTSIDADDDDDYVAVTVDATDTPIWVETQMIAGAYDSWLFIEDAEGTQLGYQDDHSYWSSTYSQSVYFLAPEPGTYYVNASNLADYSCAYSLFITVGSARRIAGADRFATAAAISQLMWDNTQNPDYGTGYGPYDIFLANAYSPADALAGAALAAQAEGVLLLTGADSLPAATAAEIERVAESRYWNYDNVVVHLLGGENAISTAVENQVKVLRNITEVNRIAGADRFATAVEVASYTADAESVNSTAFIVNGYGWADALAAAPVAAYNGSVVLMSKVDDVPTSTVDWMNGNSITDVVVVGGSSAVGPDALDELGSIVGTANVEVLAGANRYATAQLVAQWGTSNAGMTDTLCTLASGVSFADALCAAPISWWTGGPLLLTDRDSLRSEVASYFAQSGSIGDPSPPVSGGGIGCYVLGGTGVISETTYAALRDHWMVLAAMP